MHEITETLDAIDRGETLAASKLLPLVYDDLRKVAAQKLAHEKPGQTLDATALVHEAYLRLVAGGKDGHPRAGDPASCPRCHQAGHGVAIEHADIRQSEDALAHVALQERPAREQRGQAGVALL